MGNKKRKASIQLHLIVLDYGFVSRKNIKKLIFLWILQVDTVVYLLFIYGGVIYSK